MSVCVVVATNGERHDCMYPCFSLNIGIYCVHYGSMQALLVLLPVVIEGKASMAPITYFFFMYQVCESFFCPM